MNKSFFYTLSFSALSLLIVALGGIVITGWYTQSTILIQVVPGFAPMQFNTALCFVLVGMGFCALPIKKLSFISKILGFLVGVISLLSLLQYVIGVNFGLDNLFMEHYVTDRTSHPGRMAPNTALCFLLTGIALSLGAKSHYKIWIQALAGAIGAFTFFSFIGYASGADNIYTWGTLTRMAVHTTFGFLLVSLALFIQAHRIKSNHSFNIWDIAPVISFVILLTITFFAWYSSREFVEPSNQIQFLKLVKESTNTLEERFNLYEQALFGGVGLIKASNFVSREEWRTYVEMLNVDKNLPGISGVGYIDYVKETELETYLERMRADGVPSYTNHPETDFNNKFVIRYSEPVYRNEAAIGLDIGFEKNRREGAEKAIDTALPALTRKIELVQDNEKRPGFLLLVPVYDGKEIPESIEKRREDIIGWVYAPFIGENFLSDITDRSDKQLAFTVYDGEQETENQIIYSSINPLDKDPSALREVQTVQVASNTWTIVWCTTPAFKPTQNSIMPIIILKVGLLLTALASSIFFLLSKTYGHIALKLNENEKRLTAVVENAVDGLITINEDGKIKSFNKACEAMFGYHRAETLNQSIETLIPKIYQDIDDQNIICNARELEAKNKDGYVFPIELSVSEINVEGQKLYSGIMRDISIRKQAEEEIMRSNEELERFAYIASHDLQEPLRMVSNFTGLLSEEYGKGMDDQAREYMKFTIDAAKRMQALIADLLEYSRVGQEDAGLSDFDSKKTINNALKNLADAIEETKTTVKVDEMPNIFANPVRFSRLVQNLVGNAIKYRHPDRKPEIHISAEDREKDWLFSVRDNGIGIKEEYLEQIFVIFKRLHNKDEYTGTGIGLAVCNKIVESFGGQLWVESEFGQGSIFYFTVPKQK